uniref:Uncharacterized protein n=1 Tax=Anguilla anguilla TaxID=7936 RepID=A0A0E9WMM9_ANGAN
MSYEEKLTLDQHPCFMNASPELEIIPLTSIIFCVKVLLQPCIMTLDISNQ